jgi:hypothetical protein
MAPHLPLPDETTAGPELVGQYAAARRTKVCWIADLTTSYSSSGHLRQTPPVRKACRIADVSVVAACFAEGIALGEVGAHRPLRIATQARCADRIGRFPGLAGAALFRFLDFTLAPHGQALTG